VRRDGKRFGGCTCKAGQNHVACKHLAAAAGLHVCVAEALRTPQGPPVLVSRKPAVSTFRGVQL
jgi:uncharacterized Zn finger protein